MSSVFRIDGDELRSVLLQKGSQLCVMPGKARCVAIMVFLLCIDTLIVLVAADKYLNHGILEYKKNIKDVPWIFIIIFMVSFLYFTLKCSIISLRTILSRYAVVLANKEFIVFSNHVFLLSNLSKMEIIQDRGDIYITVVDELNKLHKVSFYRLYPNLIFVMARLLAQK